MRLPQDNRGRMSGESPKAPTWREQDAARKDKELALDASLTAAENHASAVVKLEEEIRSIERGNRVADSSRYKFLAREHESGQSLLRSAMGAVEAGVRSLAPSAVLPTSPREILRVRSLLRQDWNVHLPKSARNRKGEN